MRSPSVLRRAIACAAVLAAVAGAPPLSARQDSPHAITWVDARASIERFLREAPIARFEDIPIGVTRPKRAFFAPGSPVASAAWKPLAPGVYKGYWESYRAEIAAYELDKLLRLNMVPPTVERTINAQRGALIMWVDGVRGWDQQVTVAPPDPLEWSRQIIRMKMFDQLIGNIDRNQGNLLYDGDFHIVLIDHSRAFTGTTDLKRMSTPTRFDAEFWTRIGELTPAAVEGALSRWIGRREMQAIFARRTAMQQQLDELIRTRGEALAFIR